MKHLIAIQNELKAPKSRFNKFGGFNYRSCEDILEAVKPLCREHECLLLLSDDAVNIGDRYYIRATATLITPEQKYEVSAYAREDESKKGMDGSQISGTASSYARKYALNGLFNIDDTKDADTDEYHEQNNRNVNKKSQTKRENVDRDSVIGIIVSLCDSKRYNVLDLCSKTGVDKLEDMTDEQLSKWIDWLENK